MAETSLKTLAKSCISKNELSSPVHTCSMHVLSGDRTGRIPELHDGLHGIRRGVGHNGSHVPVTNTTKKAETCFKADLKKLVQETSCSSDYVLHALRRQFKIGFL